MSDSDDKNAISRSDKRRVWVHEINKQRDELGEYHRLCQELEAFEDRYFKYFRMSKTSFEELHEMLEPRILKHTTNWRTPISSRERLVICLRFLVTGDSYHSIALAFRVGRSTVCNIVSEVCKALWKKLQPRYMPLPTREIWRQSEIGYHKTWNFPNCIGTIDGKHVVLKCPKNSRSEKNCYKKSISIVLLAIVDPCNRFIVADVSCHSDSNSSILENSQFYKQFIYRKSLIPDKPLPGTADPVPHVLLGDEGFALKTYLMRPFPKALVIKDERKANFNKRLCTARGAVTNAFIILAQNWRIYLKPIDCNVDTAVDITKAICCLHNYVLIKHGILDLEAPHIAEQNERILALSNQRPTNSRSKNTAIEAREKFVSYFNV